MPTLFIKMVDSVYSSDGISIQFPLIPQIFYISDMHDFKACIFFTLVTFETEVVGTVTCAAMWHTNRTSRFWMNITANRADSFNISCCKVPLIYFSKYLLYFIVKVCHVIDVNNRSVVHQLFRKGSTELPFIQGLPYSYTMNNHSLKTNIPINVWV